MSHKLPDSGVYPVVPVRNTVVLPESVVPLYVGRAATVRSIEAAANQRQLVFLAAQRDMEQEDPGPDDYYHVGTIGRVLQMLRLPDGTVKILVEGLVRAHMLASFEDDFLQAHVEICEQEDVTADQRQPLVRSLWRQFDAYLQVHDTLPSEVPTALRSMEDPGVLADAMVAHLPISIETKQSVLEELVVEKRVGQVVQLLKQEMEWVSVEQRVDDEVKRSISEDQRNYFKREKLKAIQKELHHDDPHYSDVDKIEERLNALELPEDVSKRAFSELEKLRMMPGMSPEATVLRNYLDWIVELPWHQATDLNDDIDKAAHILDEDHYGLQPVKERILEALAVQMRVARVRGTIVCLVGPPGVGKTSLGQSIARAMGRQFVRIALGGVRDEAEIRGHRRTYIGAMPGRIIKAMKRAGVVNPLILLDEVDKLGMDHRGDPASALLEVLDPEQNQRFADHYLDVDYDLSQVMFMTTANSLEIPPALLDRMEVIRIPGYTRDEKRAIAKGYLLPKAQEACGLGADECQLTEGAIDEIVRHYCREAGVRDLERQLQKICRKVVRQQGPKPAKSVRVTRQKLASLLGVKRFNDTQTLPKPMIGVVNGLAWTALGGDLLHVEACLLPGKGKLVYTGSLGDVMKESIQAAWTVVQRLARPLGVDASVFQHYDMHVHVPEGATPKDGPSAGITMCTAMMSALTNIQVAVDVAMTGEITLRGDVLAIGGLKEKLLAAQSAGVKRVLIPEPNVKDLQEVPKHLIRGLEIIAVQNLEEVFEQALLRRLDASTVSPPSPPPVNLQGFAHLPAGEA